MNWAHLKQYVQYAWHVCAAAAKNKTVSAYLCCTPVNSAFLGALSVFWPAGWGFKASRMTSTVALISFGSPASQALLSKSWCSWVSMSIVGKTSL